MTAKIISGRFGLEKQVDNRLAEQRSLREEIAELIEWYESDAPLRVIDGGDEAS